MTSSSKQRHPLTIVVMVMLFGAAAWAILEASRESPQRTSLVTQVNLVRALREGEFVRPTRRTNLGSDRGRRQTLEAERRRFSEASGFLSRDGEDQDFAWVVGKEASFELDVLDPADRTLTITIGRGTEKPQVVTVLFNGQELETVPLRADGELKGVTVDVPALLQRRGRNRVGLHFRRTEMRRVQGEAVDLPIAAFVTGVRFLRPGEEPSGETDLRGTFRSVETRTGVERQLVLPGDTAARVAAAVPDTSRVVLKFVAVGLGVPFELSVLDDSGRRSNLGRLGPADLVPREVRLDLSRWRGMPVVFDLWAHPGDGEVVLANLAVQVPEEEYVHRPWIDDDMLAPEDWHTRDGATPADLPEDTGDVGEPDRPSLLLVVLDALTRRHVSAYGYRARTTPRLQDLADRGLLVTGATAPASYTLASVGTLLTGLDPMRHGVVAYSGAEGVLRLGDGVPTLAGLLAGAGYRTAAWITNPNAGARHGYGAGFERYDELFTDDRLWDAGVDGTTLAPRLTDFLDGIGTDPFFAYVHVFEPHAPWTAPDDLLEKFVKTEARAEGTREWIDAYKTSEVRTNGADWRRLRQLYDARVAWADRILGRILGVLEKTGRAQDTLVVVTSDHGEAFGEHASIEHGDHVYGEQIEVPLVIAGAGIARGVVDGPATLADVPATLLAAAGVPIPEGWEGVDLRRVVPPPDRPRITRSSAALPVLGYTRGRYKLVIDTATRRRELYDLAADPLEERDLSAKRPATLQLLYQELVRAIGEAALVRQAAAGEGLDPVDVEQLAALGYTAVEGAAQGEEDGDPVLRVLRSLLQRQ